MIISLNHTDNRKKKYIETHSPLLMTFSSIPLFPINSPIKWLNYVLPQSRQTTYLSLFSLLIASNIWRQQVTYGSPKV